MHGPVLPLPPTDVGGFLSDEVVMPGTQATSGRSWLRAVRAGGTTGPSD